MKSETTIIQEKLKRLYGEETGLHTSERLQGLMVQWKDKLPAPAAPVQGISADEGDAVMITYGDNIRESGSAHLDTLRRFAEKWLKGIVSGIHILPFSPYSSDDGFSVIDYRQVNPEWGSWKHISAVADSFRLMADLVLNHCSVQNEWFRRFQAGDEAYANYFITVEPSADLSKVFRPRTLPLAHEFEIKGEKKLVWTTFSRDQVDLNFANPEVFLEFADILLFYVSKGMRILRLDAVGFLWKEIGTSCMHHPNTHEVIKLFRLILKACAPNAILITETNVPHKENISYFGNGSDEAHLVYQFPLPPLTLYSYLNEDASRLTAWAADLPKPCTDSSFFNFLASHDGIGVLPARGWLSEEEISAMAEEVKHRGGRVSYKSTPNGDIPYELNISYRDAVAESSLPPAEQAAKFLSSQAVLLCMAGVPGIYIHSLLGSGNWAEGVELTGVNRSINREKLNFADLDAELDNKESLRRRIFGGYARMLKARGSHPAFHPAADQEVHHLGRGVFAIARTAADGRAVLCIQSVRPSVQAIKLPGRWSSKKMLKNLITGTQVPVSNGEVAIQPWDVLWLEISE